MEHSSNNNINSLMIIVQWVLIIFLVVFCVTKCKSDVATSLRNEQNEKIAKDSIHYFKNKIGTLSAQVGTYQVTNEEFKSQFLQKDQNLKKITNQFIKLQNVVKFSVKSTIDTMYIPFNLPIVLDNSLSDTSNPFKLKSKDWLQFEYQLNTTGIRLKNISATINIFSVTGFKKNWFLGRNSAVTEATSETKGVVINNLSATTIVVPKKFYETNIFLISTGFLIRSLIPIKL